MEPTAQVDQSGISLRGVADDRALDVLFDDRRIWSFWSLRDTDEARDGRRVAWPTRMLRFLHGDSEVVVRDHVSGHELHRAELHFGTEQGTSTEPAARVAFVNKQGLAISLDKSGRFHPEFSVRSAEQLAPLLAAMHQVIEVVGEQGIEAFPAYGTLLGAVREQNFLGHDSDADLGYVSAHTSPVDVVLESFRLQRAVAARGMHTFRYSGGAFRVDVTESDGSVRGLDLFGGYLTGPPGQQRLYLMGEVGVDFEESWLRPFGTVTLAGDTFPAPARPEKLLEAMYGPGWMVPDPAYKFETPQHTVDRLDNWFRGFSPHRNEWLRNTEHTGSPLNAPLSDLARRLKRDEQPGTHVLDLGAGRGTDALRLARSGFPTTAYDYATRTLGGAQRRAERRGLPLQVRTLNLTQLRAVLHEGARVARTDGPRAVLARHVLDATTARGRDGVLRLASMALRGGGRAYLQFRSGGEPLGEGMYVVGADAVTAQVERLGGTVTECRTETDPQTGASDTTVVAHW